MNSLITLDCYKEGSTGLANVKLDANIRVMVACVRSNNNSNWKYAKALAEIINEKQYVDDFEKVENFANALGLNKSRMSQYKKAVEFINSDVATKWNITWQDCKVDNAYLMATISHKAKNADGKTEIVDDAENFIVWCNANKDGLLPWTCTQKTLKELIKEFKAQRDAIESDATESDATESDATESDATESDATESEKKKISELTDDELKVLYIEVVAELKKRQIEM